MPAALGVLAAGAAHAAFGVDDTFTAADVNAGQQLGNVLANDGGTPPLTIIAGTGNHNLSRGNAFLASDGSLYYTPRSCTTGTDGPFVYVVQDSSGPVQSANVSVTIDLVAPTVPDTYVTPANTLVSGNVLDNDLPAGNTRPVVSFTAASHGTAAVDTSMTAANGHVTYTPNPGFSGVDTFDYSVTLGISNCISSAAVSVTVQPIAVADTFATPHAALVSGNLLGNDIGTGLNVTSATPPAHGSANVAADGSFIYVPAPDFSGTDVFQYTIQDSSGDGQTSTAAVTINVAAAAIPAPAASQGLLGMLAALLAWLGLRRRRED